MDYFVQQSSAQMEWIRSMKSIIQVPTGIEEHPAHWWSAEQAGIKSLKKESGASLRSIGRNLGST